MVAERWRVYIVEPRREAREKTLYLRAKPLTSNDAKEQRLSANTLDRQKAEHLRAVWEGALNRGGDLSCLSDLSDPTIIALLDARIASMRADPDTSPNTVRSYDAARKAFAATSIATVGASQVSKRHLMQVQLELRQKHDGDSRCGATVALMMSQAAAVWRWAQDDLELTIGEWPRIARKRRVKVEKTKKRPYNDDEVARMLAWVRTYQGGQWLPVFQLLADTSARIGMVLGLHGKDVRRGLEPAVTFRVQWVPPGSKGAWRTLKTHDSQVVPVPAETIALLPHVGPDELLFPNIHGKNRPARLETIRDIIKRALKAIGIVDAENLDTHSLRRAWVKTAKREHIPNAVGMRITGHKEEQVYNGYERNATGDDLRSAVQTVHDARKRAGEALEASASPTASPDFKVGSLPSKDLEPIYDLTSKHRERTSTDDAASTSRPSVGEAKRTKAHEGATIRDRVWGRLDPIVARVAEWADQDPRAMLRLLDDAELRSQLRAALHEVTPEARRSESDRAATG